MKLNLPITVFHRLRSRYLQLEARIEGLRRRIPVLPRARVLLVIFVLLAVAAVLFGAYQLLAPRQTLTVYSLPYVQNFDDVNLRRWFINKGVWTIRDQTLAQTVGGDEAGQLHVPFKLPEDQAYHVSVLVTLKKDTRAAGLVFNSQYPGLTEKQHRVYISRPQKDRLELVSGNTDDSGSFIPQAQIPLDVNSQEFRLDVFVYDTTYLVMLNGQRLVEKRPLVYKNGLIGFYALGPAAFDTFKLTAADTPDPGNLTYSSDFDQENGGGGWVPISGTWRIADQEMRQSDPTLSDAGIAYETSTFQNYTLRATLHHTTTAGAGVMFNMPSPYQINGAQVVRFSDQTDALLWGFYDGQGQFQRQGFALVPPVGTSTQVLQIFSGESSYDVYLDDQLMARNVPMTQTQGHVGLITSRAAASFAQIDVFPLFASNVASESQQLHPVVMSPTPLSATLRTSPTVAVSATVSAAVRATASATATALAPTLAPTVATTPLPTALPTPVPTAILIDGQPYQANFIGELADQGWKALSGDWHFENGKLLQSNAAGADLAAVYTGHAFKRYTLSASLVQTEGTGAGILFNMPDADHLAGAHMVRYSERRSNALIWGYYDSAGIFKGQGYADVEPAGVSAHNLRVVVNDTRYAVYLDDKLIVDNLPLQNNGGYIGLLTTKAAAAYEQVEVDRADAPIKPSRKVVDTFGNVRSLNGNWTIRDGVFTQSVPSVADYLVNLGEAGQVFTAEMRITLPVVDASSAGGGFIFHMADRGSKRNAYIVRLREGGQGIWWGSTDANGNFKGQGSLPLASPTASPTTSPARSFYLKLLVNVDRMTVAVNNQTLVRDVKLDRSDGWIGLLAYGGPVVFDQIKIDLETDDSSASPGV